MKQLLTILSFISVINFATAQTFTIQMDTVTMHGLYTEATSDTDFYAIQTLNHLHNLSTDTVPSFWIRDIQFLTPGWTTNCCDPVSRRSAAPAPR